MTCVTGWRKLARGEACAVCGSGADRRRANTLCLTSADGTVVGCGKGGGAPFGAIAPFKHGKRLWFYRVAEADPAAGHVDRRGGDRPRQARRLNFDRLFATWHHEARARADWVADLAAELGVSVASLTRLGIGWAPAARATPDADPLIVGTRTLCRMPGAWVFPMRDAERRIVGARVRTGSGSKYAVTTTDGDGIFAPTGLRSHQTVLLPEGPTSAAALVDLGFNVIGRPANRGGVVALVGWLSNLQASRVIVVGDLDLRWNDRVEPPRWDWPGHDGAREVEAALADAGFDVEVRFPAGGHKDARDWVRAGVGAIEVRRFWGRRLPARTADALLKRRAS